MSARDLPNLRHWVGWGVKKAGKQVVVVVVAVVVAVLLVVIVILHTYYYLTHLTAFNC